MRACVRNSVFEYVCGMNVHACVCVYDKYVYVCLHVCVFDMCAMRVEHCM